MKKIDMENWDRRQHYEFFKNFDYPHYSISSKIDISEFKRCVDEKGLPFFMTMVYMLTKSINMVGEFKMRIRNDQVIEHEVINPIFTTMTEKRVFNFCSIDYREDYNSFIEESKEKVESSKSGQVEVSNDPNQDDCIYITCLPWVSFTHVNHPVHINHGHSIPVLTIGKYFKENEKTMMPFSVQAHHGLVDGIHMGDLFRVFQEVLDEPEKHLN